MSAPTIPTPPSPVPSRKWLGLPKWLVILLAAVIVVVCSCTGFFAFAASQGVGSAVKHAQATLTTGSRALSTSTTSTTHGPVVGHVGDTLTTTNHLDITLAKVSILAPGPYDTAPSPGDEFIAVTVTFVNHSSDQQDYNSFQFHVKTGAGNIVDQTFTSAYTANQDLNSGSLSAGGTVTGDMTFQVPTGDHQAMLTWQGNIFSSDNNSGWLLGL